MSVHTPFSDAHVQQGRGLAPPRCVSECRGAEVRERAELASTEGGASEPTAYPPPPRPPRGERFLFLVKCTPTRPF